MNGTKSADYSGASLSPVPEKNLNLIVAETCRRSVLLQIVNPNYTIEKLGLKTAPKATYDILTDISINGFTGSNLNGEVWEPDSPFKTGEIQLCQSISLEKKFSRKEAYKLAERWETVQSGYEHSIGQAIAMDVEYYGLRSIMSQAYRYNVGVKAGKLSHAINLGTSDAPVIIGEKGIKVSKMLQRMRRALVESVGNVGQVKVVTTPAVYDLIVNEQSKLGTGLELNKNPLISGVTSPMLGLEVFSTQAMPTYLRGNNGKRVEYIMMVNPEHLAAPMDLNYLEWQTIKRDIFLVGEFDFDVVALSGASVVVGAVIVDDD